MYRVLRLIKLSKFSIFPKNTMKLTHEHFINYAERQLWRKYLLGCDDDDRAGYPPITPYLGV